MKKTIAVLPGDGIGPEVMTQALRVLEAVGQAFGHTFETKHGLAGGAAFDQFGTHMPEETLQLCRSSDAILFGSVGGPVSELHLPKWHNCEANSILALRKTFRFNANFRPVKLHSHLEDLCPLKKRIVQNGIDILFLRELLGDAYFGKKETSTKDGIRYASDLGEYNESQIASVAHVAFKAAQKRRRKQLHCVDKANVLDTSKLWRVVVSEVAREYPDVNLDFILVDNCAMQLVLNPAQFDVVLCPNMFGDILTDEAAVLAGSLGLLASASMNADGFGLFEPPGGSAQDIAGKGIANPIAQILSAALMLRFAFQLDQEAAAIEQAVDAALLAGNRTADIYRYDGNLVGSKDMADKILSAIPTPARPR